MKSQEYEPAKKLRRSNDNHFKDTPNTQKGLDSNLKFQSISPKTSQTEQDSPSVPNLYMSANEVQDTFVSSSSSTKVLQTDTGYSETPEMQEAFVKAENISHPVIIEMFCGTARVTACLKAIGLRDSFGVDHIKSKAVSTMKIADLTTKHGQDVFLGWLESPLVQGIFIAPPCGTCSLARCIKLRDEKGRPIPGPVPLRSEIFPQGLPNSSPRNRLRVSLANKLYEFVGRVIRIAHKKGLIIAVENPRSSLFWATRWWRQCGVPMQYTAHQACAYGSERPKWTVVAHNRKQFTKLNCCCPGESKDHCHKPWGRTANHSFATSEETAYPVRLAGAIASAFGEALGWTPPVASLDQQWDKMTLLHARVASGNQPKASKIPPLIPEHKRVIVIKGPIKEMSNPPVQPMQRLKANWPIPDHFQSNSTDKYVPDSSQFLRSTPIIGQVGVREEHIPNQGEQAWGVPFTPQEFVATACQKGHPKNFENLLPPVLKESIHYNTQKSIGDLVKLRAQWFKKWVSRAKVLDVQEVEAKAGLQEHLSRILAPKRILLWEEMLREANYPDMGVVNELLHGTELVGSVPASGIFEAKFKPADMSVEQLQAMSFRDRIRNFYSSRSSGDDEVDRIVYEKTLEEVSSGWAVGPIPLCDLPQQCVLSRRFGLHQPNKIRLIDDLSGSLINATVQTVESPKPHTTDVVASGVLELLKNRNSEVLGRAFDLKSAYRQLGIHPNSLWAAFVVVSSDGKLQRYFSQEIHVEPFKMIHVTSRKVAIFELEFFATFCSFQVWRDLLKGTQLVAYTDNDGVRDSLIACQTSSVNSEPILEACLKIEYELGLNLWMSRVPTDSNIADDPSRGHVEPLQSVGCCRQHLDVQLMWNALLEFARGEALTSNAVPS